MQMHTIALVSPLALMLTACGHDYTNNLTAATPVDDDPGEVVASFDGDRVTLDGRVVSAGPNMFLLDYGSGPIRVEMDDWDAFQEGTLVKAGDRVIVSGRVDGRFLSTRTVEARSVHVPSLGTTFYASGADEEAFGLSNLAANPQPTSLNYSGWVVGTSQTGFDLGSASTRIRVDTSKLAENPLDDEGYQKIETGERVFVWGDFRFTDSGQAALVADGAVSLSPNAPAPGASAQPMTNATAATAQGNSS